MKKLYLGTSDIFGKEHLDMLLEMCNELIGPASSVSAYGDYEISISDGEHVGCYPWLEMCLVHLPRFLSTSTNWSHSIASRIAMHVQEFYHHPKHPVDYLYQEFKDQTAWVKRE
jgi:hypothetical protein